MKNHRRHILVAGALLLGTAVAGAAARGTGKVTPQPPEKGEATFAAAADGPVSFSGTLDRTAVLLGRDGRARMELVMAATAGGSADVQRRPTDLVVILDRSGSMTGSKIEHARAAVGELLARLDRQDRFALVAYSDDAHVFVPLSAVDERGRTGWLSTVAEIAPSGGTNMSRGLDLGFDVVERSRASGRVPHVILISDGLANQGDASPEGLSRRARRAAQGEYMLSTVGVGADFNEYLMTALADAGTGNYYYVENPRELSTVFAREFDAARATVASGLAVRIEPGEGVRVVDAAGYPLERTGDAVVFRPGSLFAGQERRVWVTFAVPQQAVGEYDLGRFSLSYGTGDERATVSFGETPRIACVAAEEEFYGRVDVDAWGRSVIVDAYNEMQEEVARAVKAGRRDEAIGRLGEFRDEVSEMNRHLKSAPVAEQLVGAEELEGEVRAVFDGPDQQKRQNLLSKEASAGALDARRAGSKK